MKLRTRAFSIGAALLAIAGTALVAAPAHAASSSPDDVIYQNVWKITKVGSPYTTYGSWSVCTTITKSTHAQTAGCSATKTYSSSLTGSVGVSEAGISSSVGFNVTQSFAVTGNDSFPIPAGQGGTIQWRAVYSTKDVTQTLYSCLANGNGCTSEGKTEVAHANKYTSPTYRYVP